MSEDRITELEIRVAELERINDDLSGQLAEQWKVVEAQRAKMDELVRRFLTVEA
ncbi:MAG: SlyX family protein, partial [Notoacmeibacter sp.]|nr:SlyX family protein [Notoacmeibacter sp.]